MYNVSYIAHKKDEQEHSLSSHLKDVAELASAFAAKFRGAELLKAAGLFHDMGKYSEMFQRRIRGEDIRVDHSTFGAQEAKRRYPAEVGHILAYLVAGHHGGLPDGLGNDPSDLNNRLEKNIEQPTVTDSLHLPEIALSAKFYSGFQISLWIRMLYSCLVDADYLDTEKFMDEEKFKLRSNFFPLMYLKDRLTAFINKLSATAELSEINKIRNKIQREAIIKAELPTGFFSLNVPTGGGKTISSLLFALHHALKNNLSRVIYAIPYTSIIEQNSSVFRKAVGEGSIIEHHSNLDRSRMSEESNLASENWDAPIIATTNVQFFESLFANRSSRCRKLHNIANSVIILDEAQMIPVEYLLPCLETLKELVRFYNCTVVLCTATQPALKISEYFPKGIEHVIEIVPEPVKLFNKMKRVEIVKAGDKHDKELLSELDQCKQVLCIVNTKGHARKLFEESPEKSGLYHLSASMCGAHRKVKLEEIKTQLNSNADCRVISTQLIECGVDIDFPVVYRALAGIDSIAQAAGRCNREGKAAELGKVHVFQPEKMPPPGDLRKAADIAKNVIGHHDDPLSNAAIEEYFRRLYKSGGDNQDQNLDREGIIRLLKEGRDCLNFPFKTVSRKFQFIGNETESVIIPYDNDAKKLIKELRDQISVNAPPTKTLRNLQPYSVQVYPAQLDQMISDGAVELIEEKYAVLSDRSYKSYYSEDIGLTNTPQYASDPRDHMS